MRFFKVGEESVLIFFQNERRNKKGEKRIRKERNKKRKKSKNKDQGRGSKRIVITREKNKREENPHTHV